MLRLIKWIQAKIKEQKERPKNYRMKCNTGYFISKFRSKK